MTESELLKYAMQRCWAERSWLTVDRINCGTVIVTGKNGAKRAFKGARNGTADIIGYYAPHGRYIGIELKVGKNKQQEEQIAFEKDVKAKGGLYVLIKTTQELENLINELRPQ